MKAIRYDPPVKVSGYEIVVVCVVRTREYENSGACAFVGEKCPVAVVCRSVDGESFFSLDGRRLDKAALQTLISQTSDYDGASATPNAASLKTAV